MLVALLLALGNPLEPGNAFVPVVGEAWARVYGYNSSTPIVCNNPIQTLIVGDIAVNASRPGSSAALWQAAYNLLITTDTEYVVFVGETDSRKVRQYVIEVCDNVNYLLAEYAANYNTEAFRKCTASPAPTAAPTAAPTYGPVVEEECSSGWEELSFVDGPVYVRYCDSCSTMFNDSHTSHVYTACPPLPTEALVRNNTQWCDYCYGPHDVIEMMYCPGTAGCAGTHNCSTNFGLFYNACTGYYPNYGPMSVNECVAAGSPAEDWSQYVVDNVSATRYCDVDICNETYVKSLSTTTEILGVTTTGNTIGLDIFLLGNLSADFLVGMPIKIEGLVQQDADENPLPDEPLNKICGFYMLITEVTYNGDDTTSIYTDTGSSLFVDQPDFTDYNYLQISTEIAPPVIYTPSILDWENHQNACSPLPSEGRIRNNLFPCDYCIVDGIITMMYCANNTNCTGQHYCLTTNVYSTSACTVAYPVDYGPLNEDECTALGGTGWTEYNFTTGLRYLRTCNTPLCNDTFTMNPCDALTLPSYATPLETQDMYGYCLVSNTTISYTFFFVAAGWTPSQCSNYCDSEPTCSMFTYAFLDGFTNCYFYDGLLTPTENNTFTAALRIPFYNNATCPLLNIPAGSTMSTESVDNYCIVENMQHGGTYLNQYLYTTGGYYTYTPSTCAMFCSSFPTCTGFELIVNVSCTVYSGSAIGAYNSSVPITGVRLSYILDNYFRVDHVCPALPTEARVHNNLAPCDYCMQESIEMMYCPNTCYGTHFCPFNDSVYNSACVDDYPTVPTPSPTNAPTGAPSTRLYLPDCFNTAETCSNSAPPVAAGLVQPEPWCQQDNFYKVAQYSIHPQALAEVSATADDYARLDEANQSLVTNTVLQWLSNASAAVNDGACWCKSKSSAWFPYGAVSAANVTAIGPLPPQVYPHEFYPTGGLYYTDLSVHGDALLVIENNTAVVGNTSLLQCACDYVQASTVYGCAFVCVAVLYVGDDAPPTLVRSVANNVSACVSATPPYLWVSQTALLRMLHSESWQYLADTFTSLGPTEYTWTPWLNASGINNCPLVAQEYCSPILTPFATYADLFCTLDDDTRAVYLALNYVGLRTWSEPLANPCNDDTPLHRLVPVYNLTGLTTSQAYSLFWRTMALYATSTSCSGNISVLGVQTSVAWMGPLNNTGCTGLNGCASLGSDCALYAGCVYNNPVTQTSTTTTQTVAVGPVTQVPYVVNFIRLNTNTDKTFYMLVIVIIGVMLIASAVLRHSSYKIKYHSIHRLKKKSYR